MRQGCVSVWVGAFFGSLLCHGADPRRTGVAKCVSEFLVPHSQRPARAILGIYAFEQAGSFAAVLERGGLAMPGRRTTGLTGTSVWLTEEADRRLNSLAERQPKRPGRGAGGQKSAAIEAVLAAYEAEVNRLAPEKRPCCVGTLIGYPGAAYTGRQASVTDKYGHTKLRRTGERLQEGCKRVHVPPRLHDLVERVVPYGVVFETQVVDTRPGGKPVHPQDKPDAERQTRTGRPLTDVLMSAVILHAGPLADGPLASIQRQVLPQGVARHLWRLAALEVGDGPPRSRQRAIQQLLEGQLPALVAGGPQRFALLCQAVADWSGSLDHLNQQVDRLAERPPTRRDAEQLPLFEGLEHPR